MKRVLLPSILIVIIFGLSACSTAQKNNGKRLINDTSYRTGRILGS